MVRKLTTEEKLQIVLEGLRGEIKVSELCRRYALYPTEFQRLKQQVIEGALKSLKEHSKRGKKPHNKEVEALKLEKERLEKAYLQLSMEHQLLKKSLD